MSYLTLEHDIVNDAYTEYVYNNFDIQNREKSRTIIENNIRLDFDWKLGVIYGGSGAGKTTLLKTFGEVKQAQFDNSKALISNFDFMSPEEATNLLTSMGISSIPVFLRPYCLLSNGEQYRAAMAMLIGRAKEDEITLIDEYTSVVDRDVAKAMSSALSKYVKRSNKKVILASCHFDIMEWLQPDWIYSPNKRRVERPDLLRPRIRLEIFRCRYETWKIFKQHHYLSEDLNLAAQCYLALWNDKPVAFCAVLPFPGIGDERTRRISRIVVMPDYQGLGIGKKLVDYFASLYAAVKSQMYIRTINPGLGIALSKDKNWTATSSNMKNWNDKSLDTSGRQMLNRVSYSFKYTGVHSTDSTDIITFNADAYKDVSQNQIELF